MDNTKELIELIRAGAQMDSEQISEAIELFLYDSVLYDVGENGDAIYQTIIKIDNDNEEELYSIYMVRNDMWGTEPDDEYRFVRVYEKRVMTVIYSEKKETNFPKATDFLEKVINKSTKALEEKPEYDFNGVKVIK